MKRLTGKKALITGSSRGIGRQIAIGLAQEGCDIILHGRKLENLKDTEKKLQKYNVKVYKTACELSAEEQVNAMLMELDELHPVIDIIYNNAAISCEPQILYTVDKDLWNRILEINFFALMKICNHFLPKMIKNQHGRIINFTSGIENQPEMAPYAVSKAAVNTYTKDMAVKLKGTNVLMNLLTPGWVKTDMGGKEAISTLEDMLPGVIVPALLPDNGPCGTLFKSWEMN